MTEQNFSRPKHAHPFTRVRDKETGHHFSAPYPADRLPDHLEPLDQPALDRNGGVRPAKPSVNHRSSSRRLSSDADDTRQGGQANRPNQSTPEAKEADQS